MAHVMHFTHRRALCALFVLLASPSIACAAGVDPLERLHAAYAATPGVRVAFHRATTIEGDTPPGMLDTIRKIPGVIESIHPDSGRAIFGVFEGSVTYAGRSRLRIETRNLMVGGDPARSIATSVWCEDHTASVPRPGAPRAEYRPVLPETGDDRRRAYNANQRTTERARAEAGFVALMRYVSDAMRTCAAPSVEHLAGGLVAIRCPEIGLEVRILESTGEAVWLKETMPDGSCVRWRWEGWLPGPWFPARHPKTQYVEYVDIDAKTGAPTTRQGDVVFFDSIAPATLDDASFHWTSLAPAAINLVDHSVLLPDGRIDPQATAKQRTAVKPTGSPDIKVDAKGNLVQVDRGRFDRRYLAVGIVALLAGLALWLRKRLR